MAIVRLKIEGDIGTISLRTLLSAIQSELSVLADLDLAVSRGSKPTIDWLVTKLETSSLAVEIKSKSIIDHMDVGPDVANYFVGGMEQIERNGTTPAFFGETTMGKVSRLLNIIGRDGATGLALFTPRIGEVDLSPRSSVNAKKLIPVRYSSIGSVEGRIEAISIHKTPRFVVYLARTGKGVSCRIVDENVNEVKEILGKRVNVSGTVHYNYLGEPVRVDVEVNGIRQLRNDSELPTTSELTGYAPNFTGDLSTSEYLGLVRG